MSLTPRIDKLEPNLAINGGLDFWQRIIGASYNLGSGNVYTADRIQSNASGSTSKAFSLQRSTDTPTVSEANFVAPYSHTTTVTTNASLSDSADIAAPFIYRMEGQDYANIHGQTATFGFWIKVSIAGIYSFNLNSGDFSRTYASPFTVPAANTWTFITKTVVLETSTTHYAFDNTMGLEINIAGVAGSSYSTSTFDQWINGLTRGVSTGVNWLATMSATIKIAMFSIVKGSGLSATSFKRAGRTIGEELTLAQRYYEKSFDIEDVVGSLTFTGSYGVSLPSVTGGGDRVQGVQYKVVKRGNPVVVIMNPSNGATNQMYEVNTGGNKTVIGASTGGNGGFPQVSAAGNTLTTTCSYIYQWLADAEL